MKKHHAIRKLKLQIVEQFQTTYIMIVTKRDGGDRTPVTFNYETKALTIDAKTKTGQFLLENEHQFRQLLHNKRSDTYYVGFDLNFSIIDHRDIKAFNDKQNIIVTEGGNVYVIGESSKDLLEVFTDGSFNETLQQGAYGFAVFKKGRVIDEVYRQSSSKSSSHLELQAVIEALAYIKDKQFRIITDSQYVRKGITEWIYHWQENGFMTANGTKAKNAEDWQYLRALIADRYVEWVWIKGHRDNKIHNRVDHYVRLKSEEKTEDHD